MEKAQLTKANSLFSTSVRAIDTVSKGIGGALIALVSATSLFVVDSVTFAVAAVLFLGVSVPKSGETSESDETERERSDGRERDVEAASDGGTKTGDERDDDGPDGSPQESDGGPSESSRETDGGAVESYLSELRDGIDYVRGSALVPIIFSAMVINFGFMAADAVLPAFAESLGGPDAYGVLLAAIGAGTFVGSAGAFLVEERSVSRVTIVGYPIAGVTLAGAVTVPGTWPTAALLFATAVFPGTFNVMVFTLVQSAVDESLLGRVSSLVKGATSIMAPTGALFGGTMGGYVGTETVLYLFGAALPLFGLYFLAHPALRSLPPAGRPTRSPSACEPSGRRSVGARSRGRLAVL
ncbi:MFS transporter [Halorussus caseinilyticus]|uniref:MFS transporter n=1 Tax=Halorussus caseinilyticus TaxID=3034025 RepID=A0ABD5WLH3_9EURY